MVCERARCALSLNSAIYALGQSMTAHWHVSCSAVQPEASRVSGRRITMDSYFNSIAKEYHEP